VAVVLLAVLAVSGASMWLCAPAGAHTGDQSYVYLDVTEKDLGGRVEFPFGDVRTIFGLSLAGSGEEIRAEVAANGPRLQQYAAEHLRAGTAGTVWPLDFQAVEVLDEGQEWTRYVVLPFVADLGGVAPPRELEVTFDPFFDEIDGRTALLLIGNDWEGGVIDNAEDVLIGFDGGSRSRAFDLGDTSRWTNFWASVKIGLDHIRTGPDHIAFVFVLLLPSVLVFVAADRTAGTSPSWAPGGSFGQGLWRVLKIATMFTLAHSITFTLAGLELLPLPPSKLIESVIALSIAAAAIHNLRPLMPNREWMLAFAFGLFHGLGFASLVSTLDVSRTTQLVSLFGRNVGIELGQAIVILMAFPALHLLRRTRLYRPGFIVASLALALVALGWTIERIFEVDLGIAGVVDRVVAFPRSLAVAALVTALAALLFLSERRRQRLLPTPDDRMAAALEPTPPRQTIAQLDSR
jgi:hypothetical protein